MPDRETLLKWLRKTLKVLGIVVGAAYLVVLVLLLIFQRDILFVRGRHALPLASPYQAHIVREAGGTQLTIWEAQSQRAHAPTIVFFYGNAGTLSDFADIGAAFQQKGFDIVLASYRGYAGNTGMPSEDGLMADARAILRSLPKEHGNVILWGQSLGSGVAARMASEGRGSVLVLQSPYTAVVDVAARRFPIYPVGWLMRDQFKTALLVSKIKVPVLIMSGTADRVVPFDMGQTLAQMFGKQSTFVAFPGGGHVLNEGDIWRVVSGWLSTQPAAR